MLECCGFVPHLAQFNIKEVRLTPGPPLRRSRRGSHPRSSAVLSLPAFRTAALTRPFHRAWAELGNVFWWEYRWNAWSAFVGGTSCL